RLRDSIVKLQDDRAQRQVRESQLQMNIDHLVAHISRSYHLDVRDFTPDKAAFEKTLGVQGKRSEKPQGPALWSMESKLTVQPDVEKTIGEHRLQLDTMGPVTLDAVHEYD